MKFKRYNYKKKNDQEMLEKTHKVQKMLESFATQQITDELLIKILKMQELVKELTNNVSHD